MDQQAAYRVKCHLDNTSLRLKNGFTGHLKKGMTFQAHCLVVNRTLLQLLWDKTDDWLNPFAHATN
jgi:HlyD family secretion protein